MSTPNPPRENLVRALCEPPELIRSDNGDAPILRGHFAVWDTWTEINSVYEGRFLERFAPGSMTKTISEGQSQMRVLFQHGKDPQIGDKPLGTIERLEPDSTGAYYEVRMFDTSYNSDLLPGLQAGVYGASHRFQVVAEEFNKKPKRSDINPHGLPERTVTEAKVREFGPVTWGAYPTATAGVRSMTDEYLLGQFTEDPDRLAELIDYNRLLRGAATVTITYGNNIGEVSPNPLSEDSAVEKPSEDAARDDAAADMEPELSEATTPADEPEPSEATTRTDRGLFWFADTPAHLKEQ